MFSEIRNGLGEKLDYEYQPGMEGDPRIVVLGHGVTGNKDRPVVVAVAAALQKAGIATLRFSFAGNGGSEGRFEDCTITKEVEDLGAVLDALEGRTIAYGGHSMGGAVGVLRASRDSRIKVLISIAGMVDAGAFALREFGEETPDGGCMWEEPSCPLSSIYMNDMAKLGSIEEIGASIEVPWLLVHGTEDDVVPIADSIAIEARATGPHRFLSIDGADHSFSEHAEQMAGAVAAFVTEYLV